jgi:hypothetical protein
MPCAVAQDCNLVLYNSQGRNPANAVYATGTWKTGGVVPCRAAVSSAGGGLLQVLDAHSTEQFFAPTPASVLLMGGYTFPNYMAESQVRAARFPPLQVPCRAAP